MTSGRRIVCAAGVLAVLACSVASCGDNNITVPGSSAGTGSNDAGSPGKGGTSQNSAGSTSQPNTAGLGGLGGSGGSSGAEGVSGNQNTSGMSGYAGAPSNEGGSNLGGQGGASAGNAGAAGEGKAGEASAGAAGEGSAGSAGAAGASPTITSDLGKACEDDSDCESEGLTCVRSDQELVPGIGTAPGGFCTAPCEKDAECQGYHSTAICVGFSEEGPGYCTEGCTFGEPTGNQKCHDRPDFVCRPLGDAPCRTQAECGAGETCIDKVCSVLACIPHCTSDAQCGKGRYCNEIYGLCVSEPSPDLTFGKTCDNHNHTDFQCNGTCLAFPNYRSEIVGAFCSQECVLGYSCANGRGACVFGDHDFRGSTGTNDVGYCAPLCNCNDDCKAEGLSCVEFTREIEKTYFGAQGLCLEPSSADGQVPTLECK